MSGLAASNVKHKWRMAAAWLNGFLIGPQLVDQLRWGTNPPAAVAPRSGQFPQAGGAVHRFKLTPHFEPPAEHAG